MILRVLMRPCPEDPKNRGLTPRTDPSFRFRCFARGSRTADSGHRLYLVFLYKPYELHELYKLFSRRP